MLYRNTARESSAPWVDLLQVCHCEEKQIFPQPGVYTVFVSYGNFWTDPWLPWQLLTLQALAGWGGRANSDQLTFIWPKIQIYQDL